MSVHLRLALLTLIAAIQGLSCSDGLPSESRSDDFTEIAPSAAECASSNIRGTDIRPAGNSPKRLFNIIPNNRADEFQKEYKPLTTREKFNIARSDSFDWPNYFLLAGYAVQSQVLSGGFQHNGGMSGFAKFYGRSLGDQIIGSYITEAILPSVFHEDPRFFRIGTGSVWHRVSYASSRVLVTRADDGRYRFNFSEIAGNASIVALTRLYYPNSGSFSDATERFGMQLGNDVISNLVTEFWPDIKRRLRFRGLLQSFQKNR